MLLSIRYQQSSPTYWSLGPRGHLGWGRSGPSVFPEAAWLRRIGEGDGVSGAGEGGRENGWNNRIAIVLPEVKPRLPP